MVVRSNLAVKLHLGRALLASALAREFSVAYMSSFFGSNGHSIAETTKYRAMLAIGFANYQLHIGWLVERRLTI